MRKRCGFLEVLVWKIERGKLSDIRPPEGFDLVPLHGMFDPHVIAYTVRVGEGFGTAGYRTGGGVSGVVMVQMSSHGADVL